MKKAVLFIIMGIIISQHGAYAYESSTADAKKAEFYQSQAELRKKVVPYYNNLVTCSPMKNELYQIYGKKNGLCKTDIALTTGELYTCNLPIATAKSNGLIGKNILSGFANFNIEMKTLADAEDTLFDMQNYYKGMLQLNEIEQKTIKYYCKPAQ